MKNLASCMLMLLIFSAALLSTTFAQNQAGYAAAGDNIPATNIAASGSSDVTNITEAGGTSAQINPAARTTYVSQLANVSAIFGLNKAVNMNIVYVNTIGDRWVEIANEGIAAWDMSGWTLTNRENTVYAFPPYNFEAGSIVRIHEGVGLGAGIDLYTNSTTPLFNTSGDVIRLLDPNGVPVSVYTVLGTGAPPAVTPPVPANAAALGPVKSPAAEPVLITLPGQANASICPPGQALCNGICTDTSADPRNCGECGVTCPLGSNCIDGVCSSPCLPGQTNCNGTCADLNRDSRNCGRCGNVCPPEAVCINGFCSVAFTTV